MPPSQHPETIQPCIAELLRTCHYPSHINLRVEKILEERCKAGRAGDDNTDPEAPESLTGYRLVVSDGQWMINATLNKNLHRLVHRKDLREGSIIALTKYHLERAPRVTGKGQILYLAVTDLEVLAEIDLARQHSAQSRQPKESFTSAQSHLRNHLNEGEEDMEKCLSQQSASSYGSADLSFFNELGQPIVNDSGKRSESVSQKVTPKKRKLVLHSPESKIAGPFQQSQTTPSKRSNLRELMRPVSEADDSDDDFETAVKDAALLERNRQVLHELNGNNTSAAITSSLINASKKLPGFDAPHQSHHHVSRRNTQRHFRPQDAMITSPLDIAPKKPTCSVAAQESSPDTAPPLHSLASLLKPSAPLPQKNYRCSVFGVISWVSPSLIKKPGFPVKRHVKIHDQTIGDRYSGISISIFLDAEHFIPETGSIALFRGVRAQWWEAEVILNAYEGDCRDKEWFVTDRGALEVEGLDWQGLQGWWEQRKAKQKIRQQ